MKIKELEIALAEAKNVQEALDIKKRWNDRYLSDLYDALAKASPEEKRVIGGELAQLKNRSDQIFREVRDRLNQRSLQSKFSREDMSLPNSDLSDMSLNFLSEIRGRIIDLFNGLDFAIESGREIVSVSENFDDLNVPADHPSRSDKETFYVDDNSVLRPHCTVNSIRALKESKGKSEVLKVATIGNVYRRDDETSRHTHQFSQLDFLWLQKGLTVPNLKYFLVLVFEAIFGRDREYRFRNSYFPFTQPSVEIDMKCNCGGSGDCRICDGSGWLEVLGAGLFRRNILRDAGYSDEYECIAGGLGLERMAMLRYALEDIRDLYVNSFDFLSYKYDN